MRCSGAPNKTNPNFSKSSDLFVFYPNKPVFGLVLMYWNFLFTKMWAGNFYMVRLIYGDFRHICICKPTFVFYDKIYSEHINFYIFNRSSTNFDRSSQKTLTFAAWNCILLCKEKHEISSRNAFHSIFYTICQIFVDFCRNLRYDIKD